MDYLLLALLWILWCAVHSGMISRTVTEFVARHFGSHYRFYRIFFNILAVATIIPIVIFARSLEGPVLLRWDGLWIAIQLPLLTASLLLFLAGVGHYDMLQLLGFRQIVTGTSHKTLSEAGKLNTSGILSVTRHPWYLGTILLCWTASQSLDTATLVTNVILTSYLIVGALLEERKLIAEFGDEYREYQLRVPMLLPLPWKRRLKNTEAVVG